MAQFLVNKTRGYGTNGGTCAFSWFLLLLLLLTDRHYGMIKVLVVLLWVGYNGESGPGLGPHGSVQGEKLERTLLTERVKLRCHCKR